VLSGRYCAAHIIARGTDGTRTPEHQLHRNAEVRKLYGWKWRAYSKRFLAKHPLCNDPFDVHRGRVAPSQQVDHIVPHKGDKTLFWDTRNHQALCASCGGRKSAVEEGGRAHRTRPPIAPVSGVASIVWSGTDKE
jgi:5-methylcytosine-specific restriction protein A